MTKIRIIIALKKGVLDTQGKAIENALNKNLGYSQLNNVRQGKFVDLELPQTNPEQIAKIVEEICAKLLVNTVIETYTYQIIN
jgi:phosphoribosylformylglycinamidine synthase